MPAWGEGSTAPCPRATKGHGVMPGFLGAHCTHGPGRSWLTMGGSRGASRGQGSARLWQTVPGSELRVRGAAHSVWQTPQSPIQTGGTAAVVHHRWTLDGSSPHAHGCVPPANAAHHLATKVGRGGRGRYPKLSSSTSPRSHFSGWLSR